MEVIRTFHPVGQGAFYSERHICDDKEYNIVYDCGTEWRNRGKSFIKNIVKQYYNKNETIDILFISHFDYDHVSMIDTLNKSVKNIKNVVLPLLHENDKIILSLVFNLFGYKNISTLINDPNKFFGKGTKVIFVKPSETYNAPIDEGDIIDIDTLQDNAEIDSGTKLFLLCNPYWVFIPFNWNYTNNLNNLIKHFSSKFNIIKLKNNSLYSIDEIIKDTKLPKTKNGKILQSSYDKLQGYINQNSMFLYSGPDRNYKFNGECKTLIYKDSNSNKQVDYNPACIYTGDGNLNVVKIDNIYQDYWKHVSTVQIPHHGALSSFCNDFLKNTPLICPISVGKESSYGHPSDRVIEEIALKNSYPIQVTEDKSTLFSQYIIDKKATAKYRFKL